MADLGAVALVAAVPLGAVLAGTRGPLVLAVNLGPNDGRYLQGFLPVYEINPADQVATRWSTYDASIGLPVAIEGGPAELSYRFARVLPETAVVDTTLAGRPVDHFSCRGGQFETRQVRLAGLTPTPVTVAFHVDSHDRRGLGLKMDWVRVDLDRGARAFLTGAARWRPAVLSALIFVLLRWAGFAAASGLVLALPIAAAEAIWAVLDPVGLAHVTGKVLVPALVLSAGAVGICARFDGGRFAAAAFMVGYLLKAAAVFHPATFYPDVMNHRRYVFAFVEAQGSVAERGVAAQVQVKTAYPRIVAGRPYAFPYSPLFFVPFAALVPDAERVEDAMRHVAAPAAAAEVWSCSGSRAWCTVPGPEWRRRSSPPSFRPSTAACSWPCGRPWPVTCWTCWRSLPPCAGRPRRKTRGAFSRSGPRHWAASSPTSRACSTCPGSLSSWRRWRADWRGGCSGSC